MNRLQADLKKGIFAEAEKAWDKKKGKLGIKTAQPEQPAEPLNPTPTTAPAPSATPVPSSTPAPSVTPAPAVAPPPPTAASTAPPSVPMPAAEPVPEAPDAPVVAAPPNHDSIEPNAQPAPTPTNSAVEGAPASTAQPQEKQKFTEKLKGKLMAKLKDPKVQDKAEQALKKEAKKSFFGIRF